MLGYGRAGYGEAGGDLPRRPLALPDEGEDWRPVGSAIALRAVFTREVKHLLLEVST